MEENDDVNEEGTREDNSFFHKLLPLIYQLIFWIELYFTH